MKSKFKSGQIVCIRGLDTPQGCVRIIRRGEVGNTWLVFVKVEGKTGDWLPDKALKAGVGE